MKLGSLFDGAGTCPLAGSMCGVTPVWASEIEPFPVAVSSSNFPGMVHLGDITPTECARLQGMPDDWCAKVPHKDSAEYKLWGNGMALPCILYVMEGAVEVLLRRQLKELFEETEEKGE